jgi:hypothetical protein
LCLPCRAERYETSVERLMWFPLIQHQEEAPAMELTGTGRIMSGCRGPSLLLSTVFNLQQAHDKYV